MLFPSNEVLLFASKTEFLPHYSINITNKYLTHNAFHRWLGILYQLGLVLLKEETYDERPGAKEIR